MPTLKQMRDKMSSNGLLLVGHQIEQKDFISDTSNQNDVYPDCSVHDRNDIKQQYTS